MANFATRHPRFAATLALAVLSIVWGYNWVVSKAVLQFTGPLDFAAMRTLLAAASLFGVLIALRRPLALKDVRGAFVLGLLQTTGFIGLTLLALVHGGAGRTAVLVYTMPTWVILFSGLVLNERTRSAQWLAVAVSLIGLALLFGAVPDARTLSSTLLALLSAIFWAAGTLYAKRLQTRKRCDVLLLTAWQMLLGALPLAFVALAVPESGIHWTPYFVFALVYNGLLGGALAWTLWLFALARLPAGIASLGTLSTPAIGVLAAWLELGEIPTRGDIAGMLLIAFALTLVSVQAIRAHRRVLPAMGQE